MDGRGARSIPHISALDGARGAAVAGVLLFHGGHLTGGYLGVDFFFTLSGFLITALLLAEATRNDSIGLGGFWARRARRLLPALVVLMLGIAVYSRLIATPQELPQIRGDALATLAYSANWRSVFAHQSYFALFQAPSPLQHTWSLAIEEQFYLVWPLVFVGLLAAFSRATAKAVLITAVVLAAVSTIANFALFDAANTNRDYYGTDTRAAALLLGVALAAALAHFGPVTRRSRRIALEVLAGASVVFLAFAWMRLDGESPRLYHGGFLACAIAATIIIAAAVHPERGPIAHALSWRPLAALGLISYGVYLYHWPLDVTLSAQRVHLTGWPLFAVQTAVTLAVAIVSYRFIEQPIRHGAIRASQWRTLIPVGAAALLVVVVVATTLSAESLPTVDARSRVDDARRAAEKATPGSTRVLVVGNSVGYYLARDGFHLIQRKYEPRLDVFDSSIAGCHFPPQIEGFNVWVRSGKQLGQYPCDPAWESGVIDQFRPAIVFWIVASASDVRGRYHGKNVHACTEPYDSLYTQRLEKEVAILGARGARVVIPTEAYDRALGATNFDASTDCENRIRRTVAAKTGAQLVDLGAYVCPEHHCPPKIDGVTLRPDGVHYEHNGARLIARWLMDQIGEHQKGATSAH